MQTTELADELIKEVVEKRREVEATKRDYARAKAELKEARNRVDDAINDMMLSLKAIEEKHPLFD